jgi:hypothetical protein
MKIAIKHESYPVKNGFAEHSPETNLTAHGYSPYIACRNLERTVNMFFRPFEREGSLSSLIQRLNLTVIDDGTMELTEVVLESQ